MGIAGELHLLARDRPHRRFAVPTRRVQAGMRPHLVLVALLAAWSLAVAGCGARRAASPSEAARARHEHRRDRRYGCGSCHTISGVSGANGHVGPSLGDFASAGTSPAACRTHRRTSSRGSATRSASIPETSCPTSASRPRMPATSPPTSTATDERSDMDTDDSSERRSDETTTAAARRRRCRVGRRRRRARRRAARTSSRQPGGDERRRDEPSRAASDAAADQLQRHRPSSPTTRRRRWTRSSRA